jgi:hypothetical protein
MAWNLGLLGAALAAPAGAYELLETQILTGNQATVTFSNLNTAYGSTYQHLQVRMAVIGSGIPAFGTWMIIRLNGDSGSNYSSHQLNGTGSSVTSSAQASNGKMLMFTMNDAVPASAVIDVLDPFETTKAKTIRSLAGHTTLGVRLSSGRWGSNNALTSIALTAEDYNFAGGSRFSLYGLRSS